MASTMLILFDMADIIVEIMGLFISIPYDIACSALEMIRPRIVLNLDDGDADRVDSTDSGEVRALPDDILEIILKRNGLSKLARCQCLSHCLCPRWKQEFVPLSVQTPSIPSCKIWTRFLRTSSTPSCMIWSSLGSGNGEGFDLAARIDEKQWCTFPPQVFPIPSRSELRPSNPSAKSWERVGASCSSRDSPFTSDKIGSAVIPSTRTQSSAADWELVDVHAGLFCYGRKMYGRYWLCASNPLTSFSRIIPPDYSQPGFESKPSLLKLLVDRDKQSFRVIMMVDRPMLTAVYDSSTARWLLHQDHPSRVMNLALYEVYKPYKVFVWKNVVYAYCTNPRYYYYNEPVLVVAFDEGLKRWELKSANFPQESFSSDYLILSNECEVVLVLFSFQARHPILKVWKLMEPGHDALESLSDWKRILTGSRRSQKMPIAIRTLRRKQLGDVYYGRHHICFMFRTGNISSDSSGIQEPVPECLKYSFAINEWSLEPCPVNWAEPFKLHHWQPSKDSDPDGAT